MNRRDPKPQSTVYAEIDVHVNELLLPAPCRVSMQGFPDFPILSLVFDTEQEMRRWLGVIGDAEVCGGPEHLPQVYGDWLGWQVGMHALVATKRTPELTGATS